ncbi:hypothetical protein N2152v2_002699 [Parachlorella kessleri]
MAAANQHWPARRQPSKPSKPARAPQQVTWPAPEKVPNGNLPVELGNTALWNSQAARDLRSAMKRAQANDVIGLLRVGIQQGLAGPPLVTAALDRLMRLHGRREGDIPSRPARVAFNLAMQHGMALPPDAWLLVAMARGLYWLRPSAWKQGGWQEAKLQQVQDRIMTTFISIEQQDTARLTAAKVEIREVGSSEARKAGGHSPAEAADPQAHANVLIALVRLKAFVGSEAVAPFLASGVVARAASQIAQQSLLDDPRLTKDALLSVGRLEYPADPAQLAALLVQVLHVLQQGAATGGTSKHTAVAELARMFFSELKPAQPRDRKAWASLVQACGQAKVDPPVGSGSQGLLGHAPTQLPDVARVASPYECTEVLFGLGAFYGMPDGGRLAPALQPYRKELAFLAHRAMPKLVVYHDKHKWIITTSLEEQQQLVSAFAAC